MHAQLHPRSAGKTAETVRQLIAASHGLDAAIYVATPEAADEIRRQLDAMGADTDRIRIIVAGTKG